MKMMALCSGDISRRDVFDGLIELLMSNDINSPSSEFTRHLTAQHILY